MLGKKAGKKTIILYLFFCVLALTLITGGFKLYHDSTRAKNEYERICPQNYGDAISLERCFLPYKLEGKSLSNILWVESTLSVVLLLVYLTTKRQK